MRQAFFAVPWVFAFACADTTDTSRPDGNTLNLEIGALELEGITDAVWDIEVINGAETPQRVWAQRITSNAYGNGSGAATYIGPCDASADANQNTVRVTLVAAYSDANPLVGDFGTFNDTHDGAPTGDPLNNPGTMSQTFTCVENGDVLVAFNVTVMRPATQGFFDVAVNFDDIFCSAKLDCAYAGSCQDNGVEATVGQCANDPNRACAGDTQAEANADCDDTINLLHTPEGPRGPTAVIGFACSAGAGAGVETVLALNDVVVDCEGPNSTFAYGSFSPDTDGLVDLDNGGTNFWSSNFGTGDGTPPLYAASVSRGIESLAGMNKVYWNIMLGYNNIGTCTLYLSGTALDGYGTDTPAGRTYPVIAWAVALTDDSGNRTCSQNPLAAVTCADPEDPTTCVGVGATYYFPSDETEAMSFWYAYPVPETPAPL